MTVAGVAGDSLSLAFSAASALLAAAGPEAAVDVMTMDVGGTVRSRFTLRQLTASVVVYRFTHGSATVADTVRLTYALPRTAQRVDPRAAARLTQYSSSGRVVAWDAPFAPRLLAPLRSLGATAVPAPRSRGRPTNPGYTGV